MWLLSSPMKGRLAGASVDDVAGLLVVQGNAARIEFLSELTRGLGFR